MEIGPSGVAEGADASPSSWFNVCPLAEKPHKWQLHHWECPHRVLCTCNDFQRFPRRKVVTKCCYKAHQLSYKGSQSSAVSGSCGSHKDNMTDTAFSSPLSSPTHANGKDPCTISEVQFVLWKMLDFFPFFSAPTSILFDHCDWSQGADYSLWKIHQQLLPSGKASCCPFLKAVIPHGCVIAQSRKIK